MIPPMKVCEYCGKHNDESAQNCAGCGTELEAAEAAPNKRGTADTIDRLLVKCDYATAVICVIVFLVGCCLYALVVAGVDWERATSRVTALPLIVGLVLVYFRRSHRFARGSIGGPLGRILSSRTAGKLGGVLLAAIVFHGLVAGFLAKGSQTRDKFVGLFIFCFLLTAGYWLARLGALGNAMLPWINRVSQKRRGGSAAGDLKRRKRALMRLLRARECCPKLKDGNERA